MGAFDRKRLLSNIALLTKEKNIRVGDLESAAGVSPGYFSRLNKGDSTAVPNIEVLDAVCDKIGVTLDSLLKVDYAAPIPSERYLIDFIDKLISKTTEFELQWECEPVSRMTAAGMDKNGKACHPLFETRTINHGTDFNGYPEMEDCAVYNSLFHEGEFIGLLGPAYHVDFDHNSVLWLVDAGVEDDDGVPDDEIEFYMQQGRQVFPICHSVSNGPSVFNEILFSLYNAAAESSKRPKINPEVKSAIDCFMEDLPF